jgi:hypothetical protein
MEYVPAYGKTVICCTGPGDSGFRVTAFDGAGTYTDLTAKQHGTHPLFACNSSFPMIAYDSRRHRLLLYADTNSLWQHTTPSNAWTQIGAAGSGPVFDAFMQENSVSNAAGYDPQTETLVLMFSKGQSNTPGIYELTFDGEAASTF